MESQPQNPEFRINPEKLSPIKTCCGKMFPINTLNIGF